jgi:hypothetical protein
MQLPDMDKAGDDVREMNLSDEERWLIGFHLRRGGARPSCTRGERCSWEKDKIRIANDLYKIKHWNIIFGDAFDMPISNDFTYFIDPPYTVQKHRYNHALVDYQKLKLLIDKLDTQVIVCGNSGDKWLDFQHLVNMQGNNKVTQEMVYLKNCSLPNTAWSGLVEGIGALPTVTHQLEMVLPA